MMGIFVPLPKAKQRSYFELHLTFGSKSFPRLVAWEPIVIMCLTNLYVCSNDQMFLLPKGAWDLFRLIFVAGEFLAFIYLFWTIRLFFKKNTTFLKVILIIKGISYCY